MRNNKNILYIFLILLPFFSIGRNHDTIYVSYDSEVDKFFRVSSEKAMEEGILSKEYKVKKKARISFGNQACKGTVRLKGDWTDHLKKDKWSLRVELDSGSIYKIRKFSLQFPETRGGVNEALFHRVLKQENVLTTEYKFIHLVVNNVYWGLFAFEEHPDKNMLTNNGMPQGVLLKFNEEGFWECQRDIIKHGENKCYEYPIFEASKILPFNKKSTYGDTLKMNQFLLARRKLSQWQDGKIDVKDVNVDSFAKYYALCDVFEMYHGLQWHNQRFYFNPSSNTIEPVAYDCFSEDHQLIGKDFLGQFDGHYDSVYFQEQWFNYQLYQDSIFVSKYYKYLDIYSIKEWDFSVWSFFDDEVQLVHDRLGKRKEKIAIFLKKEQDTPQLYLYEDWKRDNPHKIKKYDTPFSDLPFFNVSLRAVIKNGKIEAKNFHLSEIEIIGVGNEKIVEVPFESIFIKPRGVVLIDFQDKSFLYFKSNEKVFKTKIELENL